MFLKYKEQNEKRIQLKGKQEQQLKDATGIRSIYS
jgi:hypothetical protein